MPHSWLIVHGGTLEWAALAPCLFCGWAAPVLWLRWRAWRAGRDRRAHFERAAGGPLEDGRIVTLKGRLEQGGAACARFEDGTPAAVSSVRTRVLATVVRAEHLVLRGAQTVTLEGPLEVLVGSRLSARGQPLHKLELATVQRVSQALVVGPDQSVWFQSLSHRDAIWAQGRLVRSSSETDDSTRWRLVPATDRIPLLYRGWPHVKGGRWWHSPLATMVAILLYFALAKLAYVSGAYELAAATPYRNLALLERDPEALASLRKRSEAPLAQYACTVLYAELVRGDERLRALESCAACRTKRALLTLPWLLGVEPACPRGQEESTRCTDWLLEAKPALRHAQWDYTQPLPWVLYAMPGVESNVNRYLVESLNRTERVTDAWTWIRDRMGAFATVTWPSSMHRVQPLLDEFAKARDSGQPLTQSSRDQLKTLLARAALDRTEPAEAPPALRRIAWEQGTCYRPRGWYDRELDPRRTLANLLWTAQSLDANVQPEQVAELWLTARTFASALEQPDTMVALVALHH